METGGVGWWGRDLGFKWMQRWVRKALLSFPRYVVTCSYMGTFFVGFRKIKSN